jgi:hypothetical protein
MNDKEGIEKYSGYSLVVWHKNERHCKIEING